MSALVGAPVELAARLPPDVRQEDFTPNAEQGAPAQWATRLDALAREIAKKTASERLGALVPCAANATGPRVRERARDDARPARVSPSARLGREGGAARDVRRRGERRRAIFARRRARAPGAHRVTESALRERARRRGRTGRHRDAHSVRNRVAARVHGARRAARRRAPRQSRERFVARAAASASTKRAACSA